MSALDDDNDQNHENQDNSDIAAPTDFEDWHQIESLFANDFYDLNVDGFSANYIANDTCNYEGNTELNESLHLPLSDDKNIQEYTSSQQNALSPPHNFTDSSPNETIEKSYPEGGLSTSAENKLSSQFTKKKESNNAGKVSKSKTSKHSHKNVQKSHSGNQKKKKTTCVRTVVTETIFNGSIADIVKTRKRGVQGSSASIDGDFHSVKGEIMSLDEIIPSQTLEICDTNYGYFENETLNELNAVNPAKNSPTDFERLCKNSNASDVEKYSPTSPVEAQYLPKLKSKSGMHRAKKKKKQHADSGVPIRDSQVIEHISESVDMSLDSNCKEETKNLNKPNTEENTCSKTLFDIKSCSSTIKLTDEVKQQVQKLFSPVVEVVDIKNLSNHVPEKAIPVPAKKKLKGIEEYKAHKAKRRKECENMQQSGQNSLFANSSASSSPKALFPDLNVDSQIKFECLSPSWPNLTPFSAQSSPVGICPKEPIAGPSPKPFGDVDYFPDDQSSTHSDLFKRKYFSASDSADQNVISKEHVLDKIKSEKSYPSIEQSLVHHLEHVDSSAKFGLSDQSIRQDKFSTNTSQCDINIASNSKDIYKLNDNNPLHAEAPQIMSPINSNCSLESFASETPISSLGTIAMKAEPLHEKASPSQVTLDSAPLSQVSPYYDDLVITPPQPDTRLKNKSSGYSSNGSATCSSKDVPAQYRLSCTDESGTQSIRMDKNNKSLSTNESGYDSEKYGTKPKRFSRVSVSSNSSSSSSEYSKSYRHRQIRSPSQDRPLPYKRRSGSLSDKSKRIKSPHKRNRSRSQSPLSISRFRKKQGRSNSRYHRSSSRSSDDGSDSDYSRPARYSRISESPDSRNERRYIPGSRYSYKRSRHTSRSSNSSRSSSGYSRYSRSPQRKNQRGRRRSISRSPDELYSRKPRRRSKSGSRNRSYSPRRSRYESSRSSHASAKRRPMPEEKQRQKDERRVLYVGRIPDGYTTAELRSRFASFGGIEGVRIHIRNTRRNDNYGFVTFHDKKDAYRAVECGNEPPLEPKFDISFGERRWFCQQSYSDYDKENEVNEKFCAPEPQPPGEINFDALLRAELKRVKSKKK